jgi:acyl dehydratase
LVGKIVAFTANMPTTFSYGFNGIRFPGPARAGQRVRLRLGVARIERFRGGLQSYWSVLMESHDAEELCLSGEWITRTYLHIGFLRRVKLILRWLGVLSTGGPRELPTQPKAKHTAAPSQVRQRKLRSVQDVEDLIGKQIGVSDWIVIDQEKIDAFAKVTGDYYWTHSDPERCKRESPYGRTIAHGALMLGLVPMLVRQIVDWDGSITMVTCAFDKIRYPAPALSGSRFQVLLGLSRIERLENDARICWTVLFRAEGAQKPCLAAEWITQARFPAGCEVRSAT